MIMHFEVYIDIYFLTHLLLIFCNTVDKRQKPWASCLLYAVRVLHVQSVYLG